MREIIFRGMKSYDGEWVYGYLLPMPFSGKLAIRSKIIAKSGRELWHDDDIEPLTIGEFTGLTDKNGKMIFEGDIVGHGYYGLGKKSVVEHSNGGFYISGHPMNTFSKSMRIHGNIHENPETINIAQI